MVFPFARAMSLLLAVIACVSLSKPTAAQQKVSVSHVPAVTAASIYVALERGYFAEQGLDVQLSNTRGGDTVFQLAGGTLDFATGSIDSAYFNALKRGMPLVAIAALSKMGDKTTHPVVVRKDLYDSGAVQSAANLKGRQVAYLAKGGINEYLLALSLKNNGLNISDIKSVAPMGFPQMAEALATKAIDAALLAEPFATIAERRGNGVRLPDTVDAGEQVLTISTNKDFVAKYPHAVIGFLVGQIKGARELAEKGFKDPEILKILEKHTKVVPEIILASALPVIPTDGAINAESVMKQQRYYLERRNLTYTDPIPVGEFTEPRHIEGALKALTRK